MKEEKKLLPGQKPIIPSTGFIKAFILYEQPRCRECGRPLWAEESIERGFGQTCGSRIASQYLNKKKDYFGISAKEIIKTSDKKIKEIVDGIRKQEIRKMTFDLVEWKKR